MADQVVREFLTVLRVVNDARRNRRAHARSEAQLRKHLRWVSKSDNAARSRLARGLVKYHSKTEKIRRRAHRREIRQEREQAMRRFRIAEADMRRQLALERKLQRKSDAIQRKRRRKTGRRYRYGVMGGAGLAMGGAALIGEGLRRTLQGTADDADQAAVDADKMGVSAVFAQQARFMTDIAGTKFSEFITAMRRMGDNASDALEGRGMGVRQLTRLNLLERIRNGELKDQQKLLFAIVEARAKLSKFDKQNIDAGIFGRSGSKQAPLFNMGADAMRSMMAEATAYGMIVSDKLTRSSQKWNDEIVRTRGSSRASATTSQRSCSRSSRRSCPRCACGGSRIGSGSSSRSTRSSRSCRASPR